MNGKESFEFNGQLLDFNLSDFWSFHYSGIYNLYGEIAEFIVARALGITHSQNEAYWALWDITYRSIRIEVKATGYYHLWNEYSSISKQRTFSIAKSHGSYDPKVAGNEEYRRQNDLYVFCLNKGKTRESAYPLKIDNWEFFVVPTHHLDLYCKNQKTISLGRILSLGFKPIQYDKLKEQIDIFITNSLNKKTDTSFNQA